MSLEYDIPWTEKYRPINVEDIVANEHIIKKINYIIDTNTMPHLIITGDPGIGKTSTILCIAKNLLGENYKDGVLELNASDDRGIGVIQECITNFCKKSVDYKIKKHKIVLLDEADSLSTKSQQLISNLMEKYIDTARFALTCNNSAGIIEAIQSRCSILKYTKLQKCQIIDKLIDICEYENIDVDVAGIEYIAISSNGDLRKAINYLQSVYMGFGDVSTENVCKICDKPNPIIIAKIIERCKEHDFNKVIEIISRLRSKGYSTKDIILSIIELLKDYPNITDENRIKYINELGKTCVVISTSIDSDIQLFACFARMINS
jgi:replication factor C subunit 2/4